MNLIDLRVVQVLQAPYEAYGKWWVDVVAEAYGVEQPTNVMCDTLEAAQRITPGYVIAG